jgi:CubicO group peptidase (beta-lactamase class C family)
VPRRSDRPARARQAVKPAHVARPRLAKTGTALRALLDVSVRKAMAAARVPGVAIGVRANGHEVAAGYGVTSVEDPLPVHERTLFQIGSVSKTFTAAAIMALVERRRLTLDEPVGRYIPGFRLAASGMADRVTVRHLLTHEAGFVGDWFLIHPPALGESDDALSRMVAALVDVPQLFPPGEGWSYNNAGFALAGRLIEVLTGRPYAVALRDLVLEPLDLSGTFVSADEAITRRTAQPHTSTTRPPRILRGAGWQPGWQLARADVPLGGLISSVHDLLGWARFHLGVRRPSPRPAPLAPRAIAAMQTPLAPAGGNADHVGISWMLRSAGGRRLVGHGGLTTGYATAFTLVPDAGAAVVVLANATPGGIWLGREVTRAILREAIGLDDAPPAPDPALAVDGQAYVGRYDNPFAIQGIGLGRRAGELVLEHRAREAKPGRWAPPPPGPIRLGFYATDRVVALAPRLQAGLRGDFGRDAAGRVAWLRWGGRLAPRLGD